MPFDVRGVADFIRVHFLVRRGRKSREGGRRPSRYFWWVCSFLRRCSCGDICVLFVHQRKRKRASVKSVRYNQCSRVRTIPRDTKKRYAPNRRRRVLTDRIHRFARSLSTEGKRRERKREIGKMRKNETHKPHQSLIRSSSSSKEEEEDNKNTRQQREEETTRT